MTSILVTGGAGFIASHYIRHVLETTDWDVVSLDRLDEAASLHSMAELKGRYGDRLRVVWHDLRAPLRASADVRLRQQFKYVVHCAAGSHVDRSVRDPLGFIADNVLGTAHLLEFVREMPQPPEKVLYFSTDEVFGPALDPMLGFDEHSEHFAANPYAASKSAAEQLCPAWATTYGLPIVVTHCTNVYGPGQNGEKFIPICARKIANDETVQIHARGGQPSSRYYIYVDDVSRAIQTVLLKGGTIQGRETGKYNIGGLDDLSNLDVAKRVAKLLGKPLRHELVDFVGSRPRHDQSYAVAGDRLAELGWRAEVGFNQGLMRTLGIPVAAELVSA